MGEETGSSQTQNGPPGAASPSAETTQRTVNRQESRAAINRVISSARRSIRIFDRDLGDPGYRDPTRMQMLEWFILAGRRNKVEIVLHETRYLDRDCARLMGLFRRYGEAFVIHRTLNAARDATDALVIADEHSYWHLIHQDQPHAMFALGDSAKTAPLAHRFMEILESSEPSLNPTVLGL